MSKLVKSENGVYRQFGIRKYKNKKEYRLLGRWERIKENGYKPLDEETSQTLTALMLSLPSDHLIEGLDLQSMEPMPHQLLPLDMLETPWLSQVKPTARLRRTRLLIADEGGTGKTYASCLALRWIYSQSLSSGPIIILCPPLLINEWVKHLQLVFQDDPDIVLPLNSARWYNAEFHFNRVIVVSKYSWAFHWERYIEKEIHKQPPACVVIDEIHQGRSRYTEEDINELGKIFEMSSNSEDLLAENNLEDFVDQKETISKDTLKDTLAKSQHLTCKVSDYAIGVSATPINLKAHEFNDILRIIGAEQVDEGHLPVDNSITIEWTGILGKLIRKARTCQNLLPNSFSELIDLIPKCTESFLNVLNDSFVSELLTVLNQWNIEGKDSSSVLRLCRELHPWGRHLAMTLRGDLIDTHESDKPQFRTRREKHYSIDLSADNNEVYKTYKEFLNTVTCNEDKVYNQIYSQSLMITSHRWTPYISSRITSLPLYKGDWRMGMLPYPLVRNYEDPRIHLLADQIFADLEVTQTHGYARGCVIFTEFKGTVHAIETLERLKIQEYLNVKGKTVTVRIFSLTGECDSKEAHNILASCTDYACGKNIYPILICTSAGEVGLNMAWATTLVHWDLHPNPQRLEQRTWRLDRRLKQNSIFFPMYNVISFSFCDDQYTEQIIAKDIERYNLYCNRLGLNTREYIHRGQEFRELVPGGSIVNCDLLGENAKKIMAFINDDDIKLKSILYQSEEIRKLCLLGTTFKELNDEQLNNSKIHFDVKNAFRVGEYEASAIRDLEILSPKLAWCFAKYAINNVNLSSGVELEVLNTWRKAEDNNKVSIPLLKNIVLKLFNTLDDQFHNIDSVPFCDDGKTKQNTYEIWVDYALVKANEYYYNGWLSSPVLGNALKVFHIDEASIELSEEEYLPIIHLLSLRLIKGNYSLKNAKVSYEKNNELLNERYQSLNAKCNELNESSARLKQLNEEDERPEYDWLIHNFQKSINRINEQLTRLSELSHKHIHIATILIGE